MKAVKHCSDKIYQFLTAGCRV